MLNPSKTKRQFNARLNPKSFDLIERLRKAVHEATGIPASQADVVNLALLELAKKYPEKRKG